MKKYIFSMIISLFLTVSLIHCSESKDSSFLPSYFGFYGSFNMNFHSADLREMPEFNLLVPKFATGTSKGFSLGAFYEYPFSKSTAINLKAIFNYDKSDISGDAPLGLLIKTENGNYNFHHRLTSNLSGLKLEPLAKIKLWHQLSLLVGANVGISIKKSTEHSETLLSGALDPDSNNLTKTNHWSQESIGLQAALSGGLSYDFAVSRKNKYLLGFSILYSYGFADIVDELTYDVNSIRFGINLSLSNENIPEEIKTRKTVPPPPPPFVEAPMPPPPQIAVKEDPLVLEDFKRNLIKDSLKLESYPDISANKITIKTQKIKNTHPILNYIFFEKNSSEFKNEYIVYNSTNIMTDNVKELSIKYVNNLNAYYNVLNIIALRMKQNPNSGIILKGIDNVLSDKSVPHLAEKRAQTIRDYFVKIWEINPSRIEIKTEKQDKDISDKDDYELLNAELQRVEIIPAKNSDILLSPVEFSEEINSISPEKLVFKQKIESRKILQNTSLYLNDKELSTEEQNYSETDSTFTIETPKILNLLMGNKQLEIFSRTELNDTSHKINSTVFSNKIYIPKNVEETGNNELNNFKIERYRLILFDFDESQLSRQNKLILNNLADNVHPDSEIDIRGFTDEIGEEDYNLKLSTERARFVAEYLTYILKTKHKINYTGEGESNIFSNKSPEGRFLNRTVNITIKTPKQ